MIKHLAIALTAVYPLVVYFGLGYVSPAVFGVILALLLIIRLASDVHTAGKSASDHRLVLPALLIIGYSVLIALSGSELLLRGYPVLISLVMSGLFIGSLAGTETLIEKIVRATGQTINARRRSYMRRLTMVWGVFLAINALLAAYTALFSTLAVWTWYNGLVSYLLIAILLIGERIFRHFYQARLARNEALQP